MLCVLMTMWVVCVLFQIRNVETNQCLDNMARKENEKVGIFNCHGMGGNQVTETVQHLHTHNTCIFFLSVTVCILNFENHKLNQLMIIPVITHI